MNALSGTEALDALDMLHERGTLTSDRRSRLCIDHARSELKRLRDALEEIQRTTPRSGMDPHAKVGDRNAIRWNVHLIARAALEVPK